ALDPPTRPTRVTQGRLRLPIPRGWWPSRRPRLVRLRQTVRPLKARRRHRAWVPSRPRPQQPTLLPLPPRPPRPRATRPVTLRRRRTTTHPTGTRRRARPFRPRPTALRPQIPENPRSPTRGTT